MSVVLSLIMTLAVSVCLSLALTPLARRLAISWGIMDHPDPRRVHPVALPRLGGVAIFLSFVISIGQGVLWVEGITMEYGRQLLALVLGGSLMVALGVYDDVKGASAFVKLLIQIFAAYLLVHFGLKVEVLANPLFSPLTLGWFSVPFTVIWVILVTNAVNLIDGLDGLAAGISAMAALTLLIVGLSRESAVTALVAASILGSTLGFLRYNFYPATIFMGDGGSNFLGFALAGLSLFKPLKTVATVALFVPLIAFGLPFLEVSSTVIRRFWNRRGVLRADKEHIHHLLLGLGIPHRRAVCLLYGISSIFGFLAIGFAVGSAKVMFSLAISLSMVVSVAVYKLHRMRGDRSKKESRDVEATMTDQPIFHRGRK